jgi:hypothetical protein
VLLDASVSGGGANLMVFSHAVWTGIVAIEVGRYSAITAKGAPATQRLIEAIPENGGA